ncbi:glycerophosphodiester phosphodiesterase [Herbaspirillum rubrisubalbicans]|uniref:Glycerophosphodiester phosphodiesterase n=3 Tax=Herbaspirillum rubrisubalbicans TaxID=80842 RepID=A0ABX9BZ45_9BURK|nr:MULTISPECIES: glycerophosphodiester phosphodiesterase family protein [Herbaspirillum]MCP1573004.1 glycerophosphoryl diester phosphodiesterase [Herbaspirillum rubrisubalbicans]NQE47327.1 glycerophosphodiester phosphodiesterase [Herbaspirillum rubrisubalbicans]QJQ01563.1 glycerophosphodiester phosphodiesterase [Herbaspirillum rubrisubalbicans Os34]RAM63288.1 glycerophosphodiester phosphodiesterase [Herbaspirillum rubrisubalbicans]RAN48532.1 glycerophosphodiester phosphodiesterase [Herbaspiril
MDQAHAFPAWRQSALTTPTGVVLVSSHRSCWTETSENSLDGIRRCIAEGIDIGEIDVRTTRDGALVLMHDETVDRTTDGQGAVADLSLAQIRSLRLRAHGGGRKAALTARRVPTLQEALAAARGRILLNLDVKAADIGPMVAAIMETDTAHDVLLNINEGVDPQQVAWARSLGIAVQTLYFDEKTGASGRQAQLQAMARQEPTVLQPIFHDPAVVDAARQAVQGRPVRLLVNTMALDIDSGRPMNLAGPYLDTLALQHPEQVWGKLIENGVSIIQTDEPQRLLAWLKRKKLR